MTVAAEKKERKLIANNSAGHVGPPPEGEKVKKRFGIF